jgi:hypothetical protein
VLCYPVSGASVDTGSYPQVSIGYFLRRDGTQWFWDQDTTDGGARAMITASPTFHSGAPGRPAASVGHHPRDQRESAPGALVANGGRGLDDLEIATCGWVSWFNEERIHGELHDATPSEVEASDYRDHPKTDAV